MQTIIRKKKHKLVLEKLSRRNSKIYSSQNPMLEHLVFDSYEYHMDLCNESCSSDQPSG